MNKDEALRMALEALELANYNVSDYCGCTIEEVDDAITAIKQAIAEAEQEPVIDKAAAVRIATVLGWEPKREWQGLTNEEIKASHPYEITRDKGCFHAGALWAQSQLKEKNNG